MKLEHVLLGLLALKPFHGYELMKWFEVEGQFIRSNTHHSQIYRELKRMVEAGLIAFEVDPREGRPDAKIYRITEAGRDALVSWARSPYVPTSRFQEADFNARLSFTVAIDVVAAIDVIDTELTYRRAQVGRSRGRKLGFDGVEPVDGFDAATFDAVGRSMHEYGREAVDAWMSWLEALRADLVVRSSTTELVEETHA